MKSTFQCLLNRPGAESGRPGILLAATGPFIHSFDISNFSFVSTWPARDAEGNDISTATNATCVKDSKTEDSERPAKRRRTSLSREVSSSTSAEILVEKPDGAELIKELQVSNADITEMICTSGGEYVVVVTGEDKTIRVFQILLDGSLTQISERHMPKRPCAIALSPNDLTILCGDKFGDVYSLPLLGKPNEEHPVTSNTKYEDVNEIAKDQDTSFTPAASSRTVHTKKNQEALRNQQRQKKQKKEKKGLNFEHQLLLGHVSLLTDLVCANLDGRESPSGKPRQYIITSDRDEHIRVSRSIPQAHVVEGYCQGHTEFISKICVHKPHGRLLLSGGGDGHLLVWNWLHGTLRQRIDLKGPIDKLREDYKQATRGDGNLDSSQLSRMDITEQNIAVSGIWSLLDGQIIVICEGIPAILTFSVDDDMRVGTCSCIPTKCNVLDVTTWNSDTAIYSMDIYHKPFSARDLSSEEDMDSNPVLGFIGVRGGTFIDLQGDQDLQARLGKLSPSANINAHRRSAATPYSLESLRKRGFGDEN